MKATIGENILTEEDLKKMNDLDGKKRIFGIKYFTNINGNEHHICRTMEKGDEEKFNKSLPETRRQLEKTIEFGWVWNNYEAQYPKSLKCAYCGYVPTVAGELCKPCHCRSNPIDGK